MMRNSRVCHPQSAHRIGSLKMQVIIIATIPSSSCLLPTIVPFNHTHTYILLVFQAGTDEWVKIGWNKLFIVPVRDVAVVIVEVVRSSVRLKRIAM